MPTVAELYRARRDDDHVGLLTVDRSWTWREVIAECEARAALLATLRRAGPFHLGVLLENVPEYLFLLGGAALAGAAVVGINPTRRGEELARDVRHTDCQLVVTATDQAGLLDGLDIGVEAVRVLVSDTDEYTELVSAAAAGGGATNAGADDAPGDDAPGDDAVPPSPDTLYLLLFTSGSTGAPKAVRVSQGRAAEAAIAMASGSGFGPGDVMYCAMPLFHGNALHTCVDPAVASGATLVLRRRFSASGFLPDVRRFGATYFNYVGRALAHILATPAQPDDGDNTLKFAFGTDASPQDMVAFRRRFACPVVEGYGSSEGAISMSRGPGTPRQALGKPPPGTDVVILDPDTGLERAVAEIDPHGRLLNAADAIGEIVSRDGVPRFEGYYANPEADAERTRGGWFWSGDLGYRDAAGYFYFAGRTADWLRVDGENFAAAPVERILERFDGVVTAVVVPFPDPRTGDQVLAVLELRPDAVFDPESFASFLQAQPDLGTKWAPRFVRVTSQIPLTGTGKVDKRPLRAPPWATGDPVWWRPFLGRDAHVAGADANEYRLFTSEDAEELEEAFTEHDRGALLQM
ncbi:MAG TPA: AMP-binding protein [Acidimicrobiales bacterium]|nr:AMP-binding protein [Acidimicrobiales bacterium]